MITIYCEDPYYYVELDDDPNIVQQLKQLSEPDKLEHVIKPSERPWTVESVLSNRLIDICAPDIPGEGSPNVIATMLCDEEIEDDVQLATVNAAYIVKCANEHEKLLILRDAAIALLHAFEHIPRWEDDSAVWKCVDRLRQAVALLQVFKRKTNQ